MSEGEKPMFKTPRERLAEAEKEGELNRQNKERDDKMAELGKEFTSVASMDLLVKIGEYIYKNEAHIDASKEGISQMKEAINTIVNTVAEDPKSFRLQFSVIRGHLESAKIYVKRNGELIPGVSSFDIEDVIKLIGREEFLKIFNASDKKESRPLTA